MSKKTNIKPRWCSVNIKTNSECIFDGICLSGGVCSFKKDPSARELSDSTGRKQKKKSGA